MADTSTPPRPGSTVRAARRIAGVVGILLVCLIGYGSGRLTGNTLLWVRRFLAAAGRMLGADVRIVGRPLDNHVLFVANHLSWFDILAMGGVTGSAFVSKDGIAHWPVIGWLARIAGTIFVTRGNRGAARSQADTLAVILASGRAVTLFPEGTTDDGRTILPFHAALFAAAITTRIPVQPVAIDYGALASEIAWGPDESALAVAMRLIGRPGRIPITLHFLEPILPLADRKMLANAARDAIVAASPGTTQPDALRL